MEKTGREEVQRWTQENHEERESRAEKKGAAAKRMDSETGGGRGNRKKEIGRGGKMQGEEA